MKKLQLVLALGVLFVLSAGAFASDVDFATIEEKQVFYEQLENARSTLLSGGNLTEEQVKLLEDEGLINRDELDRTGGPDNFGYEFIDNEEENGPDFEWVDITGTGETVTGLADDNHVGPFDIGFDFPFYDDTYSQFYVQSNGTISFTDQYITLGNSAIPNPQHNAFIAWYWDDLNPNNGGTVYYEVVDIEGQDALCILYDEYHDYWPADGWTTSQVLMFESGKVIITYDLIEDGMDNTSCTVGIQNADGSDGLEYVYNNDPAGYPYAGLQVQFSSFEDAVISGVVTDVDTGDPIESAQLDLYYADELESLQTVFTNALGEYEIYIGEEGTFDLTAYAATYVQQMVEDIAVLEADVITQDFALAAETETVLVGGQVRSADTPETPLEGVTVTLPEIGEFAVTNALGIFNLGNQLVGEYTFEISYDPPGSEGYHNLILNNVEVNEDAIPLIFEVFEIMPPQNPTANSGDAEITLNWEAPANHPEDLTLEMVEEQIEIYEETLERFRAFGAPDEVAKIPQMENELLRLQSLRAAFENEAELDQLTDFAGYRIKIIYEDDTEEILPGIFVGESHTLTGLTNGEMYGLAIAAEYGYDEDYLEFSDILYSRPHALGGYNFEEVDYEWIEINPDNGGPGTVILDAGDDASSGFWSITPLNFTFFDNMFTQLAACSNGWMSFTNAGTLIGPTIPNVGEPNNTIIGVNADTDCEQAGDDVAIWYYVDEDENRVVVQWFVMPYFGNTDYRFSYQAVLNCTDNSVQLNYEWADDWMDINRGGAIIGIENGLGDIAYTYDMNNLVDEMSLRWTPADWIYGNINGTVTSDLTGDPVVGAEIIVTDINGDTWDGITDGVGYYEVNCDVDFGPFSVSASSPGYYQAFIEDVVYDGENNPVVDIVLEGVPIGFTDDFEEDEGIWVVSENNIPGDWEWGAPGAGPMEDHTADGENCWATILDGNHTGPANYGDLRGDTLMTTETWFVGTEDAMVVYWHWMDYYESWGTFYGGYNFQVSTDLGETWEIVEPLDGYTGNINYLGYYDPNTWTWFPEPGFSGNTNGWELVAFPIGDYVGENVMFMFHAGNYYGTWNWRYGVAIDDIRIHGVPVPGAIDGIVTDADTGDPIENAELTLRLEGEEMDFTTTDETGYYTFIDVNPTDFNPEDYTIDVVAAFYVEQTVTDIYVPEAGTTTVDIAMAPQTTEAQFTGYLYSSDTPDTPVPNATVTIPQLGISEITDVNGYFDFGDQVIGTYTFDITYETPQPNHFSTFLNILCNDETMPLEFYVSDIMLPQNFNAILGDGFVDLSWSEPANHDQLLLAAIERDIEATQASIDHILAGGIQEEIDKLGPVQEDLEKLIHKRDVLIAQNSIGGNTGELDEVEDFIGYRILQDGEVLDILIENMTTYTVTGLANGHEYSFAVAADYGYDEEYMFFTEPEFVRPLPDPGYIYQEIEYEWIEIHPDEGGDGIVAVEAGDDSNGGERSFAPLEFDFYGITYDSFGACTNGWFSFTDFTSGTIGPGIPNDSPWQPNALVCALNGDYHADQAGDELGAWYLIDEDNNQVIIQYRLRPYSGAHTDYRHNYQVILNCDNGSMRWNYQTSEDWMEYNRNGGICGVENEDGTIGSPYAMTNIHDEMSLLVRYVSEFGNVVGTVTDDVGDPVEDAYVFLQEDPTAYGVSNASGYYEILLANTEDAPYTVVCHADGYEHAQVDDVNWDDMVFDQVADFVLTEIGPRTPPYFISWSGDYDDQLSMVMGEPGTYEHLLAAGYDDGTAANAWMLPENGTEALWAVPFEITGDASIVQAELRFSTWNEWPDAEDDAVVVQVFTDSNGLPGEVVYSSGELLPVDGKLVFNPGLDVSGKFWVGYYVPAGNEAICVDSQSDHGSVLYYTLDGENWLAYDAGGDPLVRLDLYGSRMFAMTETFETVESDIEPGTPLPVSAAQFAPRYGYLPELYSPRTNLLPGWDRFVNADELDEFLGFNVYYSLDDGVTWEQDNAELITENTYDLVLGSELEDDDILVYLTAMVDSAGTEIESDPSLEEDMVFNMAPAAPGDVFITNINHPTVTATISWDVPTTNADGTPLIDLVEYELYRSGEYVATIPFDQNPLEYDEAAPEAGYYVYTVMALDEVPNRSGGASTDVTRIGDPPFWSSFEPDMVPEQPNPFEAQDITWEWGEPGLGPQGGYDNTANCWATQLDANYMTDQEDWLISTHAWDVIGPLRIIYYHWYDFDWDSGYNLQVSTDNMDTWTVVTPEGGYANMNVWALQQPGFHLGNMDWQQVEYDLSQFNDADSIHIAFRFASAPWGGNNYGVAIDNLEIWGVPREARGWVTGVVLDANDQPMQGAHLYLEDMPFFEAWTGGDGSYMLMNVPAGDHDIICEYPFYWPIEVEDFEVVEDDTLTLDFTNESGMPLVFPDGELETTALQLEVNLFEDTLGTADFDLESIGTGPLNWNAYIRVIDAPSLAGIPGDGRGINPDLVFSGPRNNANGRQVRRSMSFNGPYITDPQPNHVGPIEISNELDNLWDILVQWDVQTTTGNDGIVAAVTTSDSVYVSATYIDEEHGGNFLYTFSHQGFLYSSYEYPAEMLDAQGMGLGDLAYDPNSGYLFGANSDGEVFQFMPDFSEYSIITTVAFWPNAVAYDWDSELLYLRGWGDDFAVVEVVSGNISDLEIEPQQYSVTGLAYMPRDENGYTIWLAAHDGNGQGGYVYSYNPVTLDYNTDLTEIYPAEEGSVIAGMDIGLGWRSDFFDITTVHQGTQDYVDIFEGLISPPNWVWLEPSDGILDPAETVNLVVTADLSKLEGYEIEEGVEIYAEIVFSGSYWANTPVMDLTIVMTYDNVEEEGVVPVRYALHQNYPNPFNPVTSIKFDLVQAQNVKLSVFNVLGQEVVRLADARYEAGFHNINFKADGLASSMYFYRIETPAFTSMKKMVLVK